jgi:hypothetical protein
MQDFKNDFDGICIDAHIYASFQNSVSIFLNTLKKPIIIDPIFYKFTDPYYQIYSEKRWTNFLMERYEIQELIQRNPDGIGPNVLDIKSTNGLVKNVVDFQKSIMENKNSEEKLLLALLDEDDSSLLSNKIIVPPYFINDGSKISQEKNIEFIEYSFNIKGKDSNIYAPIVIDEDILFDKILREKLIEKYSNAEKDGFLFWVTDFKETEKDIEALEAYTSFIRDLKSKNKEKDIIGLYSGYFSLLLSKFGFLDGITQGVAISDYKNPEVVGGGGRPRYYVPIAHQMTSTDSAADLLNTNKILFQCKCPVCIKNTSPSTLDTIELAKHFVWNRVQEFKFIENNPIDKIKQSLDEEMKKLKVNHNPNIDSVTYKFSSTLNRWNEIIKKTIPIN